VAVSTLGRAARLRAALRVLREMRRPGSAGLGERVAAVPRLAAATARGRYPGLSRSRLAMLVVGAVYLVSPIDILPEGVLLLLGLADDVAVAAWLAAQLLVETDRYLVWEQSDGRVEPS
jgi:uncharacterized membrane protein YkvA (DUF1232 family)